MNCSYYLSFEAETKRKEAMLKRIAKEAIPVGNTYTYSPQSDYWLLPDGLQLKVDEQVRLSSTRCGSHPSPL